jgi:aminomethyltransferase
MSTNDQLAQTPLFDWHAAHGGRMVEFGGWSMPVQYSGIVEEHQATRTAIGLFDISHMGRVLINGPDAANYLDKLLTRAVLDMKPHQIRYSLVCNESGGILDDVLCYQVTLASGEPSGYGLVVNASNRPKMLAWLEKNKSDFEVTLEDITTTYGMFAVQGPRAIEVLDTLTTCELTSLRYYTGQITQVCGVECFVSRTGYTGEDGCEIVCPSEHLVSVWEQVMSASEAVGGRAVGLGARDTLRLEAGMPLYGHELSEGINPIQARLEFAVNLRDRDFIGSEALRAVQRHSSQPVRVGIQMDGRRVAREGAAVLFGTQEVGKVTSGTFSPTFNHPIAMAYVSPPAAAVGTPLAVNVRGQEHPATVVPLPFYERGR